MVEGGFRYMANTSEGRRLSAVDRWNRIVSCQRLSCLQRYQKSAARHLFCSVLRAADYQRRLAAKTKDARLNLPPRPFPWTYPRRRKCARATSPEACRWPYAARRAAGRTRWVRRREYRLLRASWDIRVWPAPGIPDRW